MLVLRTKLTPPHLPRRTLDRPRLTARLAEALDHRLTVVHAEAGYGKSTALALLAAAGTPTAWYHLDAEDAEPLLFFHALLHSLRIAIPTLSDAPDILLETWSGVSGEARWAATVDALVNELDLRRLERPLLLVLDDAHHLARAPQILEALNRLLERAPHHLHTVLATRLPVPLPSLPAWRLRGEVLEIDRGRPGLHPRRDDRPVQPALRRHPERGAGRAAGRADRGLGHRPAADVAEQRRARRLEPPSPAGRSPARRPVQLPGPARCWPSKRGRWSISCARRRCCGSLSLTYAIVWWDAAPPSQLKPDP